MKNHITATDLYNFRKCAYRPFMDYNGDPTLKMAVHPLVKLLWESGVQYEAQVIEAYQRDHPGFTFRSFANAQDDRSVSTLAAMREGIDIIYQGEIVAGNKIGRPDLLLKTPGTSNFGNYHYAPMDIKMTRVDATWDNGKEKVAIEQLWQVYFYGQILAAVQGTRPNKGYIYKTKKRILPITLDKSPNNYDWAVDQMESYLQGNAFGAEPAINSNCGTCEWKAICAKWADENQDISLVNFVGQSTKNGLKKLGIRTIADLATQNPEQLSEKVQQLKTEGYFWPAMPADLPRKVIARARIHLSGQPVIYQAPIFPDAEEEIHFDIEDDPTQDFVYLHGLVLAQKGKNPEYIPFFAETRDGERAITEQLFEFLNQHPNAVVYHYGEYERTTLKRLVGRHKMNPTTFDRLFDKTGAAIDLYQWIMKCSDWPLTSYGLKAISKFLGFQWDAADAGGAASIVWMNEYLAGKTDMKQKVLQYNEDDCRATLFLKNKLMTMQPVG